MTSNGLLLRTYLRDLVFGAVDGTVTTFAVVAGAVGADLSAGVVIVLGVANLLADGFSMAASNYLATHADQHRSDVPQSVDVRPDPRANALATFVAFVVVGAIPLGPFVAHAIAPTVLSDPIWLSSGLTALVFLAIGFVRARVTDISTAKSMIETLALGGGAAALAFVVGWLLRSVASV